MNPDTLHYAFTFAALVSWVILAYRAGWACARAELARLRRRQEMYADLLRPLTKAIRAGQDSVDLPREHLALLTLLAEHPGPDGDALVALQADLYKTNGNG
ncbi:hypothetical protein [Thermobispora bispora]|uniref:hypothetical protein n=1 Tax=Thermobispora bispora TaxID=2006 RepID=UPI00197DF571|nr:hypothetical protein [Thermobispora bispora]QSI50002.1 hypothetical protein CYL17_18695 [Thermobispora bispora]